MILFKRRSKPDYTDSLARYLPNDRLFAAKNVEGSNLRSLLNGLSAENFRTNGYLREYLDQIIPDKTEKFLGEWESALGIPDCCFTGTGTIEDRRRDVLVKLASLGVQTEQDFIDLAAMFGVSITIEKGSVSGGFPLQFPALFFATAENARFTIFINVTVPLQVTFPYSFPVPFGTRETGLIKCIFEKLKPANCNLVIRQVTE